MTPGEPRAWGEASGPTTSMTWVAKAAVVAAAVGAVSVVVVVVVVVVVGLSLHLRDACRPSPSMPTTKGCPPRKARGSGQARELGDGVGTGVVTLNRGQEPPAAQMRVCPG